MFTSSSSSDDSRRESFRRARASISLGAAFALFCTVFMGFDTSASQAAAGFFDDLFGPAEPARTLGYNGYAPHHSAQGNEKSGRRVKQAKRQRGHVAQARRQVVERQKLASAERRKALPERRAAVIERRPDGSLPLTQNHIYRVSASAENAAGGASRRAMCVRACDGYSFPALPISRDSDISAQQSSCAKLCPGAQATLFVLPAGSQKVEEAKAAGSGETYAQLLARIDPSDARAKSCSCQTEAGASQATTAAMADPTLRPGDTVVTPQGVRVLRRGSHYPFKATDFLSLAETHDAPLSNRSALYAIERALKTPIGRLAVVNNDHRRHRRESRL